MAVNWYTWGCVVIVVIMMIIIMKILISYCKAQKFDELIVGLIRLRGKSQHGKNFDESLAILQIHQSFLPPNFCTI